MQQQQQKMLTQNERIICVERFHVRYWQHSMDSFGALSVRIETRNLYASHIMPSMVTEALCQKEHNKNEAVINVLLISMLYLLCCLFAIERRIQFHIYLVSFWVAFGSRSRCLDGAFVLLNW